MSMSWPSETSSSCLTRSCSSSMLAVSNPLPYLAFSTAMSSIGSIVPKKPVSTPGRNHCSTAFNCSR
ncbi:MAG: hypothetical protein Q8P67_29310 [archaeon]|nr:hypothetical protein [archaeon]